MTERPSGWTATSFEQLADIKLGKMLDKAKNRGEPTPYLRNINVRWDAFDLDDIAQMRMSEEERATLSLRNGDVLVCEGGEPGRSAVWDGGPTDLTFQKALMRLRRNKYRDTDELQEEVVGHRREDTALRMDLEAALERLSETSRAVVWLHDVEGYTHEEIAGMMGKTPSFSKSQLARAHQRLRRWLGEEVEV